MICEPCEGDGVGFESDGFVTTMSANACTHCAGTGHIDPATDTASARYKRERATRAHRRNGWIS